MMNWQDYLALLSWQGRKIPLQDYIRLQNQEDITTPEHLTSIVSSLETREYLIHNKKWWKQAECDYQYCKKKNYHIYYPGKKFYPKQFFRFFQTPPVLLSLGQFNYSNNYFPITFVGSRQANELILNWMDFYLPSLLKEKSIYVVSGGARGIDQKAHGIAIRTKTPTVCFLPSGLDCFYPDSLNSFKTGVLDNGGCFISCFPPRAKMFKSYFHIRNAVMAAYSSLVLILQAQIRSGTMLTARKSLDYGIPVGVLPGTPLSMTFTGNLQLLYDGAFLIRDQIDLSLLIESLTVKNINQKEEDLVNSSEDSFELIEEFMS